MKRFQVPPFIYALLLTISPADGDDHWLQFGGPTRNFLAPATADWVEHDSPPHLLWKVEPGEGLSGLVVDAECVYVMSLSKVQEEGEQTQADPSQLQENVTALDRNTGRTRWQRRYDAGWLDEQEAFGGRKRAPQATPAVIGETLVTVGFTGIVHGFQRSSGKILWKRNLIETYGAIPVQFGFSSSPVVVGDKFLLLAGGQQGGLICLDAASGETLWNVPCDEASYATPTLLEVEGNTHVVFVTRKEIVGVELAAGDVLWRYQLPRPGMTNVPSPLPLGEGRLLVSGQGTGGTNQLQISRSNGNWNVSESWRVNTEFFYCNWILRSPYVIGCNNNLLIAIDTSCGELVGRWRGYANSNLVASGNQIYVLDGEGVLTIMQRGDATLRVRSRHQVFEARCWTPPTLVGSRLYCRGDQQIVCLELAKEEGIPTLAAMQVKKRELNFLTTSLKEEDTNSHDQVDRHAQDLDDEAAVFAISDAFSDGGPAAADKVYDQLRSDKHLSLAARIELTELALEQGLVEFAQRIVDHAAADFPHQQPEIAELKKLFARGTPTPSSETSLGENGLVYVEFALRNAGEKMLQTTVQGPPAQPFSYGIPLPPGKVRVERWPVGTQLAINHNDVGGRVLVTVAEADAGKTIDLGN